MRIPYTSPAIRHLLLIAVILAGCLSAQADIDKKYYSKVAEKVWATELPGFNPDTDLSDSIFQGQNAVFIARYNGITADFDNDINPTKQRLFGIANNNKTRATVLKRTMVKINDATAAEDFTEFSVSPDVKFDQHGHVFVSGKQAFGARIIKPDGSINEVDINEVLTKKGGKKNKEDAEHKIAIPGLEAGDILDYFYQTEYALDEVNLDEFPIHLLAKYPTALFTIDIKVDPRLNMEYGAYNGAPKLTEFQHTDDGKNLFFLQLRNVYSLDESIPYFSAARQMPLMEFYILNPNNPLMAYTPKMSRPGGMRYANPAFVMRDMGFAIVDTKVADKVVNDAHTIVKNWKKAHPEATDQQVIDAAWIAINYSLIKNDEHISGRSMAKSFYKLLEKMDSFTDARIAVTTPRTNVAINEIANFNDAAFVVMLNDRLFYPSNRHQILPGEIPASLDGENYVLFSARPDNPNLYQSVQYGTFPTTKAAANTLRMEATATIDPENPDSVKVASTYTLSGTEKDIFTGAITNKRFIDDTESFLGVKPAKIKSKHDDVEQTEMVREAMEEGVKTLWNNDEAKLTDFEVVQTGTTPDKPELIIKVNGNVPDLVSQAGNNLMVKLGGLIGKQEEVTGKNREREVSVLMRSPHRIDMTIWFEIPEGYELVEESLNDLKNTVTTIVGMEGSDATLEDGKVKIRFSERMNRSILPETTWPEMLKILDASAAFSNASIILRPKK